MKTTALENLRKHFAENSLTQLKEEWAEIEKIFTVGPKALEYINFINSNKACTIERSPIQNEFNFSKNITPDFPGYYFLRNIAI